MKIPKSIEIMGHSYRVELVKSKKSTDGQRAKSNYFTDLYIKIYKKMPQSYKEEAFLHEIIHQILFQGWGEKTAKDEKFVSEFADRLYQVMKNNKLLK